MVLPDGNVIAPTGKAFDVEFGQIVKTTVGKVGPEAARLLAQELNVGDSAVRASVAAAAVARRRGMGITLSACR